MKEIVIEYTITVDNLTRKTYKRMQQYPNLEKVVNDFIKNDGQNPKRGYLTDLTVYIRRLNIDEPGVFHWDAITEDEFYSWGHNSRYANVLEPILINDLDYHVNIILDLLENNIIFEEPEVD